MEHVTPPEAISHRQLRQMLETAQTEPDHHGLQATGVDACAGAPDDGLATLLQEWSRSSQRLLAAMQASHDALAQGRSAKQLMALGALQAHLAMALRASSAALEG